MRRALCLIVFLSAIVVSAWSSGKNEYALYKQWRGLSNVQLQKMGEDYMNGKHPDQNRALVCYSILLNRYDESMSDSDLVIMAQAFNRAGYIYFYEFQDFAKAYGYFVKAAEIAEENHDAQNQINAYQCLGNIYITMAEHNESQKNIDKSLELYRKSFNISLKTKNYDALISNFINMSSIAYSLNKPQLIAPELNALKNIRFPKGVQSAEYVHWLYLSMDAVYHHDFQKALLYFDRQIEVEKRRPKNEMSMRVLSSTYFNKAILYARMGDYQKAVDTMDGVEEMTKKAGAKDLLANVYNCLSDYYSHLDPDKARDYRYKFLELSDTLQRENNLQEVSSLQFLNEFQKIDSEMEQMKQSRRIANIIFISLGVGIIVLIVFLLVLRQKNKALNESNRELYQKNVELLRQEKLLYEKTKYEGSNLNDSDKEKLLAKIRTVFTQPEEFCSSEFSLARLTELVDSKSKYVSQVINEAYGQSFTNVLSDARIKEACKRLTDVEHYGNYTIEGIANSVGFKSRANFVTNFKKLTGLTPSAYQKMAKDSQETTDNL